MREVSGTQPRPPSPSTVYPRTRLAVPLSSKQFPAILTHFQAIFTHLPPPNLITISQHPILAKIDTKWWRFHEEYPVGAVKDLPEIHQFWNVFFQLPPSLDFPWGLEQCPIDGWSVGVDLRTNQEHPNSKVLAGSWRFEAFLGQIGLGHMYKTCSTQWDLHFCEVWDFLEIVYFSSESGRSTVVYGGAWAEASPDLPRLNLILQFHMWSSIDEFPLFEPSSSKVHHLIIIAINDSTVRSSPNFNTL